MNLPQTKVVQNFKPSSSFIDRNEMHVCGEMFRDVECHSTATGKLIARFVLITRYKEARQYLNCVAWEALAEKVKGLKRGQRLKGIGRLQTSHWEKDGQKHYSEVHPFAVPVRDVSPRLISRFQRG